MTKSYKLALHIFRRDLRLVDNTALIAALKQAEKVIPCFIFDKRQIEENSYKSDNCIQFMVQSLQELDTTLKKQGHRLYFFYGIAEEVVADLLQQMPIDAVFFNRDYTPFARNRDKKIALHCKQRNIDCHCMSDALLHEPEEVLKADGTPYTIFTPFFRKAALFLVPKPVNYSHTNYFSGEVTSEDKMILAKLAKKRNPNLILQGGRTEALTELKKLSRLKNYAEIRNFPAENGTTHLSAHHKFGTISIRESYHRIVSEFNITHPLITELHWRDFFTHIAFHFPHVFGHPFHERYNQIPWENNAAHFRAWCEGRTGFPIVDAGIRELNSTGFMHNRVRMIVASFLTKDLHIDWQKGEQYFAQQLIDYDPSVNNGNWQWAASTGCDAQPYFRIFNPWLQQEKFDPDCLYIKRFIPELAYLSPKTIHQLPKNPNKLLSNYPDPLVNHSLESALTKKIYAQTK